MVWTTEQGELPHQLPMPRDQLLREAWPRAGRRSQRRCCCWGGSSFLFPEALGCSTPAGSCCSRGPGARFLPALWPRPSPRRRLRSPPGLQAACTHAPILKTNRRRRLPAALAGFPPARASRGWEVCWQGPGGTSGLSPPARGAGARRAPRPCRPPRARSPSLRVTPSPAMQCQDCTALTHRLSSQLEKKREREGERHRRRRRTLWRATKDCTTPGWERGAPSGRPARAAPRRAGTRSPT